MELELCGRLTSVIWYLLLVALIICKPHLQCYMDTVRVSVSDSGAGVQFVRIFGDTANNTWNPTQVSESDTGAGYPTRQKN